MPFCDDMLYATYQNINLDDHNCKATKGSIAALRTPDQSFREPVSPRSKKQSNKVSQSSPQRTRIALRGPSSSMISNHIYSAKRNETNLLFELAMLETATSISFLDHPAWHDPFENLSSSWILPASDMICRKVLEKVGSDTMSKVMYATVKSNDETIGTDGATNWLGKSVDMIIVQTSSSLFLQYMQSHLKRETIVNVVNNFEDILKPLDQLTSFKGFCTYQWLVQCYAWRAANNIAKGAYQVSVWTNKECYRH